LTIKRVFISEQLSYYISIYSLIVLFFSQITDSLTEIRNKITRSKYIPYKNSHQNQLKYILSRKVGINYLCPQALIFFFVQLLTRFHTYLSNPLNLEHVWARGLTRISKKIFFFVKINIFLVFFWLFWYVNIKNNFFKIKTSSWYILNKKHFEP